MNFSTTPQAQAPAATSPQRELIAATVIGNWFEFFDFTTYALFAVTIGKQFFPAASANGQLLLSLATFGVGFLVRPLGAIVLGAYADRCGRKAALTLTIMLMAVGTAMLGLTPGYDAIGIAAPALIVLARLIQGFSAGGEMGAATSYLLEAAPNGHRARYGSWQYASQGLAGLSAALLAFGLNAALGEEAMAAWGWRLPFLLGLLIAPIGLFIRRHMHETLDMKSAALTSRDDDGVGKGGARLLVCGLFGIAGAAVGAYVIGHYMTSYAIRTLGFAPDIALLASVASGIAIFAGSLIAGNLADRHGRRPVMIWPRLLFVVMVVPCFWLLDHLRSPLSMLLIVGAMSLCQAISGATLIVAIPECFPARARSSALSIIYAVGASLFGGTAQFVVTWLIGVTGSALAPAWYLAATSLVSVVAMAGLHPPRPDQAL